jgi:uncharacterized C2H2 Zn-finger protein
MEIITQCPSCGHNWRCEECAADRRLRCPNCNKLFKVPKLNEVEKAFNKIKNAKSSVYIDQAGNTYG